MVEYLRAFRKKMDISNSLWEEETNDSKWNGVLQFVNDHLGYSITYKKHSKADWVTQIFCQDIYVCDIS